jgi:hypothetical protein
MSSPVFISINGDEVYYVRCRLMLAGRLARFPAHILVSGMSPRRFQDAQVFFPLWAAHAALENMEMQCGLAQPSPINRAHEKCGQCTSKLCMSSRKHCVRVCQETCTRVKTAIQTIFMFHQAGNAAKHCTVMQTGRRRGDAVNAVG